MNRFRIELLAENWAFAVGRQNTVRKGTKWGDQVSPGDVLEFVAVDPDAPACFVGETKDVVVTRVTKTRFGEVSVQDAAENHMYGNIDDLRAALKRAYGSIANCDVVSILEFV